MGAVRRAVWAGTAALLVTLGLIAGPTAASAATGDVGNLGPSFTGATNAPTADKPQSKMWFTADGQWWANMFDTNSKTWHIFSLNRTDEDVERHRRPGRHPGKHLVRRALRRHDAVHRHAGGAHRYLVVVDVVPHALVPLHL